MPVRYRQQNLSSHHSTIQNGSLMLVSEMGRPSPAPSVQSVRNL